MDQSASEENVQGANDAFHGRALFSNGVEFRQLNPKWICS